MEESWITLDEAGLLTGRDEAEIYIAARRGLIPAEKLPDATWRLDPASASDWAARVPDRLACTCERCAPPVAPPLRPAGRRRFRLARLRSGPRAAQG